MLSFKTILLTKVKLLFPHNQHDTSYRETKQSRVKFNTCIVSCLWRNPATTSFFRLRNPMSRWITWLWDLRFWRFLNPRCSWNGLYIFSVDMRTNIRSVWEGIFKDINDLATCIVYILICIEESEGPSLFYGVAIFIDLSGHFCCFLFSPYSNVRNSSSNR